MEARRRLRNIVVAVCFFLSGGSGLVFETLWTRKLALVFGSTTLSVASVLTAFMGGLALGSWLLGRHLADRVRRPIVWYALIEGFVGLWGLLVPLLVDEVYPHLNRFLWTSFEPGYFAFSFLRFLFVVLLLLPPTTAMGATLPLLARHFVTTEDEMRRVGRRVGALYALNTTGAILGTFAAGFLLLPSIGLWWTNAAASFTNLALCAAVLLVYLVWRKTREAAPDRSGVTGPPPVEGQGPGPVDGPPTPGEVDEALAEQAEFPIGRRARVAALIAFGVSGFAAMNYQVAWNRLLSMVIGSSVYSFTIILLAFLAGIAGGSAIASAALRPARPGRPWLLAGWFVVVGAGVVAGFALGGGPLATLGAGAVAAGIGWGFRALWRGMLRGNPVLLLGAVQLWIGLSAAVGYFLADDYPYLFAWLVDRVGAVDGGGGRVGLVMLTGFAVAALAVLPATLGMGATLPLTVRICATTRERVGRDVGTIYAINTIGAIIGSFASAFVLVPGFSALARSWFGQGYGLQLTIVFSIALNLGLALLLFGVAPDRRRGAATRDAGTQVFRWTAVALVPALVALLVLLSVLRSWTWDIDRLVAGSFRFAYLHSVLKGERRGELLYLGDGISTTVTVQRWGEHLALKNNGKVDASTGDDMPTQVMVAGLPLLLHPREARQLDVAVIGFGSGVTVGTALRMGARRVDVVELEPAVIESSWFFHEVNLLPYEESGRAPGKTELRALRKDPRLRVLSNDGRNFLASTPERYDVVVSEPSNPWITGVSNLFTLDHFRAARQALAPGGIFCQWVQLYELSGDSVKSILRTFAAAFPYVRVFVAAPGSSDTILVGSLDPLPLRVADIRLRLAGPDGAAALDRERSDITTADDVVARQIFADRAELLAFTRGATINTDDNAFIEFRAPRDLIRYAVLDAEIVGQVYDPSWPWGRPDLAALRAAGYALRGPAANEELHGAGEALVRAGRLRWAAALLLEALADPTVRMAPAGDGADDMARILRAGVEPGSARPADPLLAALERVLEREGAERRLREDVAAAHAFYDAGWPRPAAAAWQLARAAAGAAARSVPLSTRAGFLLDAARGAVEDDAARSGLPIAAGLPDDWQPLLASVRDRDVADALRVVLRDPVGGLTAPVRPGAPEALEVALAWVTGHLALAKEDQDAVAPDADAHAVRMLMQHALLLTSRDLPDGGVPHPRTTVADGWRELLENAFDPWASPEFARVLPEVDVLDAAVSADLDPWGAAQRLWSYVRLTRVRRALLESGDEWMESRGPPLPSVAAVRAVAGPPPAAGASGPGGATAVEDPAEEYARFLEAVGRADPSSAAEAWKRVLAAARASGLQPALLDAVPQGLADLGVGWALLRAGRAGEAWETFRRLLGDAKLRVDRPDLAYFAARARWASGLAAPAADASDETAAAADLLLAWQLMDRWVRGGADAGGRALFDGIPALEAIDADRSPYVPLVSEQYVRGWFEDAGRGSSFDATGIADAFLRGDLARLDAALVAAGDAAVRRPPPGEWGGAITDDSILGTFAQLEFGVESLALFDALQGGREGEPEPDQAAVTAAFARFESLPLPVRLADLRRSASFRFLDACRRRSTGEPRAMRAVLGEAVPDGAPPGSPLARLLANSAPARYYLARLFLGCDIGPCTAPRAAELARALALAGSAGRGEATYAWQTALRDPYSRVVEPVGDFGGLVIEGGR